MSFGTAVAIVFGPGAKIVLVWDPKRRNPLKGFPGGGIETGEAPRDAAIRETEEECGLVLVRTKRDDESDDEYEEEKKRRVWFVDYIDKGGGHHFQGYLSYVESFSTLRNGIEGEETDVFTLREFLRMLPSQARCILPAHREMFFMAVDKLGDPDFFPDFPYREEIFCAVRMALGAEVGAPAPVPASAATV